MKTFQLKLYNSMKISNQLLIVLSLFFYLAVPLPGPRIADTILAITLLSTFFKPPGVFSSCLSTIPLLIFSFALFLCFSITPSTDQVYSIASFMCLRIALIGLLFARLRWSSLDVRAFADIQLKFSSICLVLLFTDYLISPSLDKIPIGIPFQDGRLIGFFSNPNYYGLYLLMAVLLYVCTSISLNGSRVILSIPRVGFFLILLNCLGILFTQSRGASFALFAAFFFYLLISALIQSSINKKVVISLSLLGLVVASSLFFIPSISARLQDLISGSGANRYDLWDSALIHLSAQSFDSSLFGNGYSSFILLLGGVHWIHNSYLTLYFDAGLVGVTSLFLSISLLIIQSIGYSRFSLVAINRLLLFRLIPILSLLVVAFSSDLFYTAFFWVYVTITTYSVQRPYGLKPTTNY